MGRLLSYLKHSEQSLHSGWGLWARKVSEALDDAVWVMMGSGIRVDPTTPPTQVAVGPTTGWVFSAAFNQYAYVELPLHPAVDRTKPLIVGVGWAPAASEAGRLVTWALDIGLEYEGSNVATIDLVKSQTVAVPAVGGEYERTGFVLTPTEWAVNGVDELHVRFRRAASGAEPTLPGLHHIVLIHALAL